MASKVTAKYVGPSMHVRRISKADFKAAGVEGVENDLEWSSKNRFTQDVTGLPAEALEILKKDKLFKVTETEEQAQGGSNNAQGGSTPPKPGNK